MIKNITLSTAFIFSASCIANQSEIEFYIDSNNFTNITPILEITRDKWSEKTKNNADLGFAQSRIGIAYSNTHAANFRLHYMQRIDYELTTNAQTALGYYQEKNDFPLTDYDQYQIAIDLKGARSHGLGLEYVKQMESLNLKLQGNYWEVNYLRHSKVAGAISGSDTSQLLGRIEYQEYYTDNNFLKRQNGNNEWNTSGYGYSIDFALSYQLTNNVLFHVELVDLLNKFSVSQVGYTQADINTKGSFVDNAGFSSFRPLLKGLETEKNYEYKLTTQAQFGFDYQTPAYVYHLYNFKQGNENFTQLGLSKGSWTLLVDPNHRIADIKYQSKGLKWHLGLDNINVNKAYAIRLGLSGKLQW